MIVGLYKLYEDGVLKGIYSTREIHDLIGINTKSISYYSQTGGKYHKKYTFELHETIEQKPVYTGSFAERWMEMQKLFGIDTKSNEKLVIKRTS